MSEIEEMKPLIQLKAFHALTLILIISITL